MQILNFLDSIELNQLRLNMGATLIEAINSNFLPKPLSTITIYKTESYISNTKIKIKKDMMKKNKTPRVIRPIYSGYSRDNSTPKILHPIKKINRK